jgi:hypothetical protein
VLVVGSYGATGGPGLSALVRRLAADRADVTVALWAFERVLPELRPWTIGIGPGMRQENCRRLLERFDLAAFDWVVITDDDVKLVHGSVDTLVRVADACGAVLAQPAHVQRSHWSWRHTVERRFSVARRTTFVEVGPFTAIRSPYASALVHPDSRHGWGMELYWHLELASAGAFVIVDAVGIEHLRPARPTPVAEEYDFIERLCARAGIGSYWQFVRVGPKWRPWRGRPRGWDCLRRPRRVL